MRKTERWMTGAIVLAVFTAIPAWAQRDPTLKNERLWFFFNDAFQNDVTLKGNAKFVQDKNDPRGLEWRLRLTSDYGQASTAFMKRSYPLTDYEAIFTFEVRRVSPGESPADGFMFLASTNFFPIGAPGAGIGYAPVYPIVPPATNCLAARGVTATVWSSTARWVRACRDTPKRLVSTPGASARASARCRSPSWTGGRSRWGSA